MFHFLKAQQEISNDKSENKTDVYQFKISIKKGQIAKKRLELKNILTDFA